MGQLIEFPTDRRTATVTHPRQQPARGPAEAPRPFAAPGPRPLSPAADRLLRGICLAAYLLGFFILAPVLVYVAVGSLLAADVVTGLVCAAALVPCVLLTRAAWRQLPQV
jgi:hypothetical protein